MNSMIFIDTCIVIDYEQNLNIKYCFNSIVDMEVLVGVKNKRDLHTTNKKLNTFQNISIDQDVLQLARELLNKYVLSQGFHLAKELFNWDLK